MAEPRGDIPVHLTSFPPVVAGTPRVLILGSMPGSLSLQRHQYYAHPRNQFWPIMAEVCGVQPEWPYEARIARLQEVVMPQEAIESLASIAHSLEVVMEHQETSTQVLEQHWKELDVDMRQRLEARQMDRRHLALVLALGILLGVLLVLVGAAIMVGMLQ